MAHITTHSACLTSVMPGCWPAACLLLSPYKKDGCRKGITNCSAGHNSLLGYCRTQEVHSLSFLACQTVHCMVHKRTKAKPQIAYHEAVVAVAVQKKIHGWGTVCASSGACIARQAVKVETLRCANINCLPCPKTAGHP